MKLYRFFIVAAALLPWATGLRAENESLASIFTNVVKSAGIGHPGPSRPNIVVIACHGLALGDLSCYGQAHFQTPNIDQFAAGGMRFTDYRAGGDDLPAAQGALVAATNAVAGRRASLVVALKQAGYSAGLMGEWTVDAQPWMDGFDEFAGFLNEAEGNRYYADFVWRHSTQGIAPRVTIYENQGGQKGKFMTDLFFTASVNFARVKLPDRANFFRPFFLMISVPVPHSVTPGRDDYPVPTDAPYTDENWPQAAKNRAALVTRLDNGLGHLFEQLDQLGLTNNTAIFLAGAVAPEKFAGANMNFLTLKDEVRGGASADRLRVPMIVRWRGHVPAGRVSAAPWTAADFAPTAMAIAAARPTITFNGASMLPVLLGETNAPAPGTAK